MKKDLSKMGIDEAIVTIGAYISITDLIECFDDEKESKWIYGKRRKLKWTSNSTIYKKQSKIL